MTMRQPGVKRPVTLGVLATLACSALLFVAAPVRAATPVGNEAPPIGPASAIDDDFIVDYLTPAGPVDHPDTTAGGAAADATPAIAGGFTAFPFDSGMPIGLGGGYTIHLVTDNAQYAQLAGPSKAAAIQLTAATGIPFSMGGNVSQHSSNQALDHRITISLTSGEKCGTAGCTRYRAYNNGFQSFWELMGGQVWVNPDLLSYPGMLKETILHEFAHAAGLDHYNGTFEGNHQVMRSYVDTDYYGEYQTGDQNGLAQTAAYGVSNGYIIPRACLITITDVRVTSQFCTDIRWMIAEDISTGYSDGSFRPTAALTRQAAAAFLYDLAGSPSVPSDAPTFTDVPAGHPFRNAIRWMASAGLTNGYPDGTFRPTGTLSRQAIASFLYKLEGEPAVSPSAPTFSDVPSDHPFVDAIRWMAAEGISTGYSDGTFRPSAGLSRQAMAAFLHDYAT